MKRILSMNKFFGILMLICSLIHSILSFSPIYTENYRRKYNFSQDLLGVYSYMVTSIMIMIKTQSEDFVVIVVKRFMNLMMK